MPRCYTCNKEYADSSPPKPCSTCRARYDHAPMQQVADYTERCPRCGDPCTTVDGKIKDRAIKCLRCQRCGTTRPHQVA